MVIGRFLFDERGKHDFQVTALESTSFYFFLSSKFCACAKHYFVTCYLNLFYDVWPLEINQEGLKYLLKNHIHLNMPLFWILPFMFTLITCCKKSLKFLYGLLKTAKSWPPSCPWRQIAYVIIYLKCVLFIWPGLDRVIQRTQKNYWIFIIMNPWNQDAFNFKAKDSYTIANIQIMPGLFSLAVCHFALVFSITALFDIRQCHT